jgi:hypothetical protein
MIATLDCKAGLLFPLLVSNFRRFARNFVLTGIPKTLRNLPLFLRLLCGTHLCLRVSRGRVYSEGSVPDAGRVGVAIQVRRKEGGKERASERATARRARPPPRRRLSWSFSFLTRISGAPSQQLLEDIPLSCVLILIVVWCRFCFCFASHLAVCWTGRKRVEGPGVGLLGSVRVRGVRMRVWDGPGVSGLSWAGN